MKYAILLFVALVVQCYCIYYMELISIFVVPEALFPQKELPNLTWLPGATLFVPLILCSILFPQEIFNLYQVSFAKRITVIYGVFLVPYIVGHIIIYYWLTSSRWAVILAELPLKASWLGLQNVQ